MGYISFWFFCYLYYLMFKYYVWIDILKLAIDRLKFEKYDMCLFPSYAMFYDVFIGIWAFVNCF